MTNHKHFKHYYDPLDRLDIEWKRKVSKGFLTIDEASRLSGFSRSYLYRLTKDKTIPSYYHGQKLAIKWHSFHKWYSHLPEAPASVFGESAFTIYGLMQHTGIGRCWLLKMLDRHNVHSYHIGWHKRYNREECLRAWKAEEPNIKSWLTSEDIQKRFNIEIKDLYYAIAKHAIRIRQEKGMLHLWANDILRWKEDNYE